MSVRPNVGDSNAGEGSEQGENSAAAARLEKDSKGVVRTEGIEPSQEFPPYGFSYHFGFRRRPIQPFGRMVVRGLDYPFTLATALGAARLVSTPSRCGAWLGIAIEGFPDFEQFCIASFPASTQTIRLSPLRLPVPPRPHFALVLLRSPTAHRPRPKVFEFLGS
jgi:hypothetical protein